MQLPSPEKIDLIISIIKKTIKHYDFYEGLGTSKKAIQSAKLISQDIIRDILTNKKRVIPCYAGRLNAFIDAYGDVLPCELLEYRFGNLRDYDFDFKRLWTEPKNKKIRSFIEKRCFCTHSCIMLTNILFNPRFYSKIFGGMIYLSVPRLQRNKDDTNE